MSLIPFRTRHAWGDHLSELELLKEEMNRLFNFSLARWPGRDAGLLEGAWSPRIDVHDSKESVIVKADIPGMSKDQIDVTVHDGTLIIRGEKKQEREEKEEDSIRTERFYGSFNRAVALPDGVDAAKVSATYRNGVLEVTLPKKEEARPRQIKIDVR